MEIKTGVDIVYLPRFRKTLKNGKNNFLQRIYLPEEITHGTLQHLAGIFAAKETVMKALSLPTDCWHDILITHNVKGAPVVKFINHQPLLINHSLSIAHDGNYVIACFIAILK